MEGPQVIVGRERPLPMRMDPLLGWGSLRTLAMVFILAGLIDISVAFYPPYFSDKGWLFGVVSAAIAGLPVLSLGLTGSLLAAMSLRATRATLVFGIANAVLALLILVGLILYGGAHSEVQRNAAVDLLPTLARNTLRTFVTGGVFFVLHSMAFRVSLKASLSAPPNT